MPSPHRPAAVRGKVFRGRHAVAAGLLTPDQLRSSAWRRLYRDVYADALLQDTHGLRVTGAALLLPESAAFAGRTAAYLLGAEILVDASSPVEAVVPADVRFGPIAGMRVRRAGLPRGDVRSVGRHLCTGPVRTALDLARFEQLPESVVALDVLLARGLVLPPHLREGVAALSTGRGSRRARTAVALADGRAESPPESRLRVLLRLAGLTPEPQFVVRGDGGQFIARVDLAFPAHRVAVEYDGAWHGVAGQLARDRRRLNALVQAGWMVIHVTAADMHDPGAVVATVRQMLAALEIGELGL